MAELTKLEEDILIAEYDGQIFRPYKGNRVLDIGFKTFKACDDFIKEDKRKGYIPALGWNQGLGDYRTNFNSLMRVVDKILKESRDIGGPFGFRTFGILPDGDYVVRLDSMPLAVGPTLIDAVFEEVMIYLKHLKA